MSIPTAPTIRSDILVAIQEAVQGLAWVGKLVDATQNSEFADVFANGKCGVEWAATSDISVRAEGIDSGWSKEHVRFTVLFQIVIPHAIVPNGEPPSLLASRLYGELVSTLTGLTTHTWGGKALKTELIGGGGVGFYGDREGVLATEAAFVVTYRHARGQPGAA